MDCPLCKQKLTQKMDDQYYLCGQCHAIVKNHRFYLSKQEEKKQYLLHNNDINDQRYKNFTSPITNYVLKNYSQHHLGLDFGSGTGPVISSVLKEQNYKVILYDPFFCPDQSFIKNQYDYIILCEVLEHLYNPRKELKRLISLLKKGGVLLIMSLLYRPDISFQNWHYRNDPTHVFILQNETIEYLTNLFQLKCIYKDYRFICLKN